MGFTAQDIFSYVRVDANGDTSQTTLLDADGDGDLDLVVASLLLPLEDRALPVLVLLNDGEGGLSDGTTALFGETIPEVNTPGLILVGDYDGDARDDVFVANQGLDANPFPGARNALFLSAGGEGFVDATATLPDASDFSHSAAQGDIDGDGDLDIVVMNVGGGTPPSGSLTDAYVLLNDGAGAFVREDDYLPSDIEVRAFGNKYTSSLLFDADGDGDPDLFLGTHGEPVEAHSLLLVNDGSGDFSAAERRQLPDSALGSVGVNVVDADAADLDGDGALDLVIAMTLNYRGNRIQILMNDGAGGFTDQTATRLPQVFDETEGYTSRVAVADMNGDGFPDLVAMHMLDRPIFLNDGEGRFVALPQGAFDYPAGAGTPEFVRLLPGDANGDGRMDLYAAAHVGMQDDLFWVFLQLDPGLSISGSAADDALTGDADAETLAGLDGADVLFGAAGHDTLGGGRGADYLNGGAGNDQLLGGDGDDELVGFRGADTLNGGAGDDSLHGGAGNDLYVVRKGDAVVERAGEGSDTVQSASAWTLGAYLEHLQLAGDAPLRGTGNALANSLGGNAGANVLDGAGGDDTLLGGTGADALRGSTGLDWLRGGAGADTLAGGAGDDTLDGGGGEDLFVLDGTLRGGGFDRIADFVPGADALQLSQARFGALEPGVLDAAAFAAGAGLVAAPDAAARIVLDTASGRLYYDADGPGGDAAVAIAQFATGTVIAASDVLVG